MGADRDHWARRSRAELIATGNRIRNACANIRRKQTGIGENGKIIGEMKATGIRPNFTPRLEAAGFKLGAEIFMPPGGIHLNQRR